MTEVCARWCDRCGKRIYTPPNDVYLIEDDICIRCNWQMELWRNFLFWKKLDNKDESKK